MSEPVRFLLLSLSAVCACTSDPDPSTVITASVDATGGIDGCHDEDGDPLYFEIASYDANTYVSYASADLASDRLHLDCAGANPHALEVVLPSGTHDLVVRVYQEVLGFRDLEDEQVFPALILRDGDVLALGAIELDVNDDD
jgi:hypothetical protein